VPYLLQSLQLVLYPPHPLTSFIQLDHVSAKTSVENRKTKQMNVARMSLFIYEIYLSLNIK